MGRIASCMILAWAALMPAIASAQGAAEPWEGGCLVRGLDPGGDGFLSVRRGPGSENAEIARVRNGDALFLDHRKCQGKWCLAEGGVVGGRQADVRGWFHTGWCEFYP